MAVETKSFMATYLGNPGEQLGFVSRLVLMHRDIASPTVQIIDSTHERMSHDTRMRVAKYIQGILGPFNDIFPEWRELDATLAQAVDEITREADK